MNGGFLDWASTSPIVRFPVDTSKQWRNPNAAYAYEERKAAELREKEMAELARLKQKYEGKGGRE